MPTGAHLPAALVDVTFEAPGASGGVGIHFLFPTIMRLERGSPAAQCPQLVAGLVLIGVQGQAVDGLELPVCRHGPPHGFSPWLCWLIAVHGHRHRRRSTSALGGRCGLHSVSLPPVRPHTVRRMRPPPHIPRPAAMLA